MLQESLINSDKKLYSLRVNLDLIFDIDLLCR